jgi:DNA mismatch repair protein MutS
MTLPPNDRLEHRDQDLDFDVLTPLFAQYFGLKNEHPGCLLLMRVGDFYEAYGEDAVTVARDAEIVLTSKEAGGGRKVPMSGVPFFALDNYLRLLVTAGHRVSIAEQMEEARFTKGLVRREVIRTVTAGTILDPGLLDEKRHNFLCALSEQGSLYGCAFADISTGEFLCTELPQSWERLEEELIRMRPAELVVVEGSSLFLQAAALRQRLSCAVASWEGQPSLQASRDMLQRSFPHSPLKALDLDEASAGLMAAGLLLRYLQMTQGSKALSLSPPQGYRTTEHMVIDSTSGRNLELQETLLGRERRGSLLWACDFTSTSMGARRLRQWILSPLLDPGAIEERLDAVEALVEASASRAELRRRLATVSDIERLNSRVAYGTANARDLQALGRSLQALPALAEACEATGDRSLARLTRDFGQLRGLAQELARAVAEEPPVSLREGGLIAAGYDQELDELRTLKGSGQQWITELQERERELSGIRSLKVGYNQVFGYYIEVTRSNLSSVPEHYIRKQTLANAERYFTPELKEYEARVLGAEDKIRQREYDLFCALRDRVAGHGDQLRAVARGLSELDVLCGFAEGATRNAWTRPRITTENRLEIEGGRHPVVERAVDQRFVPNSVSLDGAQRLIVLTGPNMSGKSTYLRQNALLVIMAQMGCFVPADSATVGITDRVFTRVGASDDLHLGQSTFMVEMSEAANILRFATPRSLVVLDEIGRGTSTYDGLSLAQAIAEYLYHESRCKTLFATHFHELTRLARRLKGCRNYRVAVREDRESIVFLHRIVPGGADRSYGIHVASLAGVPEPVLARARTLLDKLERGQLGTRDDSEGASEQLDLFGDAATATVPAPAALQLNEQQIESMSAEEARAALRILSGLHPSQPARV